MGTPHAFYGTLCLAAWPSDEFISAVLSTVIASAQAVIVSDFLQRCYTEHGPLIQSE